MSTLVGLIEFVLACGTILGVAFMVCLVLPDSPMKSFATQVIGWAAAAVCGLYVAMPFDLVPEGLLGPLGAVDDIGALMLGIGAAIAAKRAGKDVKEVSRHVTQTLSARHARGQRSRHQRKSDAN